MHQTSVVPSDVQPAGPFMTFSGRDISECACVSAFEELVTKGRDVMVTRRRISASMRAVHSEGVTRQHISASARGKAKTCALCGEAGHNKRTCPLNPSAEVRRRGQSMKSLKCIPVALSDAQTWLLGAVRVRG